MSVDTTLKLKSTLARHRNVLTRAERVARLIELDKWGERSPLGMPKVSNRKLKAAGKKPKKGEEE